MQTLVIAPAFSGSFLEVNLRLHQKKACHAYKVPIFQVHMQFNVTKVLAAFAEELIQCATFNYPR